MMSLHWTVFLRVKDCLFTSLSSEPLSLVQSLALST